VSLKTSFGAKRQEKPFYTTPLKKILPQQAAKDFCTGPTAQASLFGTIFAKFAFCTLLSTHKIPQK
jgi:hypothetical protein